MTSSGLGIDGDEPERLIESGEGPRTEFEESPRGNAPERIREAVRAFANDLSGSGLPGLVAVGPRDDPPASPPTTGRFANQPTSAATATSFRRQRSRSRNGSSRMSRSPSDSPPVRFKGSMHARAGPRRAVATAQEERVLAEKRRFDAPLRAWSARDGKRRPRPHVLRGRVSAQRRRPERAGGERARLGGALGGGQDDLFRRRSIGNPSRPARGWSPSSRLRFPAAASSSFASPARIWLKTSRTRPPSTARYLTCRVFSTRR